MARKAKTEETPDTLPSRYSTDHPVPGFFPTGSTQLDLTFGGKGYPLGRIINIVGDFSSYKSGLGVEACINFHKTFPDGLIRYVDSESAFDEDYAEELGLSRETVNLARDDDGKPTVTTVKETMEDLLNFLKTGDPTLPRLYVLDSLDALIDDILTDEEAASGYAGAKKAAAFTTLLNRVTARLSKSNCMLLIISQLRMNIGVMYGPKFRRAGGKALDFFSSAILWMNQVGILEDEIDRIKVPVGIESRVQVKKNKLGKPFREFRLVILFGYGIDDEMSCLEWLQKDMKVDSLMIDDKPYTLRGLKSSIKKARKENKVRTLEKIRTALQEKTKEVWKALDDASRTTVKKYGESSPDTAESEDVEI